MEAEEAVFEVLWEMLNGSRKRSLFCDSDDPYARSLFCV